ncbi:flagellar basal body-associated protein FliL [Caldicoprobacter guelmensis]|uniref:flagellar basal body-associated FliL family protein n=1 Tax=Caldicoprobacter guelmensis TaxID=1170224 RepID=UPI0019592157|nr:flagellar basal body-associated FliL family protein [Caldicoprobacter guelmensis]MBM7581389.1 flagellar basal body-associated protein FliL [Caldicoprobacter guelmensis]
MNTRKLLAIIVPLFVIVFIGMGVILYLQLRPAGQVEGPQKNDNRDEVKKEVFVFHDKDPFITNLKDSDSYLKADISIEVGTQKDVEVLNKNLHRVRDRIIAILRDVSEDDMKRSDIQEVLKNRIKQDLQESLKIDTIIGVYFNEFVMQ